MAYEPPPPPANGGTSKEYLQRIEAKADEAKTLAQGAVTAVEQLRNVLVGDPSFPWDHGRVGRFEEKFDKFVVDAEARDELHKDNNRFRISNRLASISVIVVALIGLGSIIVTLIR